MKNQPRGMIAPGDSYMILALCPLILSKKSVKTHLYLKYFVNDFLLYLYYLYDISVSTMCIYCDYCVYHYKSTELGSLYTLDIGL